MENPSDLNTPQAPLRAGIIGVTGYAKHVLESFLPLVEKNLVRFSGATVRRPENAPEICSLLQDMGCRIFPDYRQMLEALSGRVDICIIPTGIESHLPMSAEAMAHGAHVLVEKPLASCVADAQGVIEASSHWQRRVAVGFQDLCSEPILEAKRRIVAGELGAVRRIRAIGAWPRGFAYYQRNAWAGCLRKEGKAVFDSPLNNAFGHLLNLGLFFAGPSLERAARPGRVEGCLYRTYPIESFDTASIHVSTDGGAEIACYVSHASEEEIAPCLVVEGDHGHVKWLYEKTVSLVDGDGRIKWSLFLEKAPELRKTAARIVTMAFAEGTPLVNSAESALSHVMAIEQLHAAAPIQGIPKEKILEEEGRLYIGGSGDWLRQSFADGVPLTREELLDPVWFSA